MSDHELEKSLISAYCDGELNATEQARAEELLATSPTARAELQSYRQISNLLQEAGRPVLGRTAMGLNLTSSVLGAIEELEAGSAAGKATRPDTTPAGPNRRGFSDRRWAAFAASAACLAAVVWISLPGRNDNPIAQQQPNQKNDSGELAGHDSKVQTARNQNDTQNTGERTSTIQPGSAVVAQNQTVNETVNGQSTTPPMNALPMSPSLADAKASPLDASQLPVELIADLKNASPGHITRFIRQNSDGVTVFRLMVMDVKPGLESLEMILAAHQISSDDGKPVSKSADVVAVYVEAKQDKMEALVQQIQADHQKFLALAVQEQAMPEAQAAGLKSKKGTGEQAIAVDSNALKNVGIAPLQPQQIEMARNAPRGRTGGRGVPKSLANRQQGTGDESPMLKLLIVVEKANPSSLSDLPN